MSTDLDGKNYCFGLFVNNANNIFEVLFLHFLTKFDSVDFMVHTVRISKENKEF